MASWLDEARGRAEQGSYRKALKSLNEGLWRLQVSDPATSQEAEALANRIANETEGRLSRRARDLADEHRRRAGVLAESAKADEHLDRLRRIETNVAIFVLLAADDDDEDSVPFDAVSFSPVAERIAEWRSPLEPCYLAGYTPVNDLGRIVIEEAEQVRVDQLRRETVNEIVLQHASAVEDIGTLRRAVPACLGYAIVADDIRARELLSTLERRSGRTVALPSTVGMGTAILDAMEAARLPADERELFKFIAAGAFHIGVGAGVEDVLERSTPAIT